MTLNTNGGARKADIGKNARFLKGERSQEPDLFVLSQTEYKGKERGLGESSQSGSGGRGSVATSAEKAL